MNALAPASGAIQAVIVSVWVVLYYAVYGTLEREEGEGSPSRSSAVAHIDFSCQE